MSLKDFKNIDDQCIYAASDKKIIIKDEENFKNVLLNNNYYRFINSVKIDYCKNIDAITKKHQYEKSESENWIKLFKKDWYVREFLLLEIIRLENKINSRVAYYIGLLNNEGYLNTKTKQSIVDNLNNINLVKRQIFPRINRDLNEVWKYISNAEFKIVENIIKKVCEQKDHWNRHCANKVNLSNEERKKRDLLNKSCDAMLCGLNPYDSLSTFRYLRNALVHQVSLYIFFTSDTLNSCALQNRYDLIFDKFIFTQKNGKKKLKSKHLKRIMIVSKEYVHKKRNINITLDFTI